MSVSKVRGILLWFLCGGFLLTALSCEVGDLTPPEDSEEDEIPQDGEYASRNTEAGITFQRALGTYAVRLGDTTLHFV